MSKLSNLTTSALVLAMTGCYRGLPDRGADGAEDGSGDDDGSAGDGGSADDGDEPFQTSKFECDPTQIAPEVPLRRLSRAQYQNAVRDIVAFLVPEDAQGVLDQAQVQLGLIPADAPSGPDPDYGGLTRLDQSIFQETVEGAYNVGAAIGTAIVEDPTRLGVAVGSCASDDDASNDAACMDEFVRRVGPRILRRPLSEDDVAFYLDVAGPELEVEDYTDILAVLLAAPNFLYFIEEGEGNPVDGRVTLSAHELAARLSFHFWQTIPDDELVAIADSGDLLDPEIYAEQVDRLFQDSRTTSALTEFYGEWLDPPHLGQLDASVGMPDYDAFLDGFVPTADTRDNMAAELAQMSIYYTLDTASPFEAFFRSDRSFATTEDVAGIYGVPVWADGEPPQLPPEREGVITRALLLSTGSAVTHPVLKGVFARKNLLCDSVPDPPADAMAVAMQIEDPGLTARDRAVAISEAREDCASCHTTFINPLGFVTENFDGLGRLRSQEKVFDKITGELLAEVDVDTSAVPRVDGADERPASTAAELNQFMLESEKPQACFARRYFRFTFGRPEDDARDGCTLAEVHRGLLEGDDLGSVMRSVALRPEFQGKNIEEGE